jgi:D-3-phosphoglycerate dehydrogenase
MKILFIDTVHPLLWDSLKADGHHCIAGYNLDRSALKAAIRDADGIVIRSSITIDKELLDAAGSLRFIARAGAGMENIDVPYATEKGMVLINSPEGNRDAVGEHAVGMLLSLFNNLNRADREVREGYWSREENRGRELKGMTVGILGYGNMGSAFASKLRGFDCRVIAYDKYKSGFSDGFVREVTMEEFFRECDVLSLHVPLTKETEYIVDDAFIQKFRKNIFIINTARGKCLKTDDLVMHLKTGKVRGACLDVLEYEDTSFEKFNIRNSSFEKSETWQYLVHSGKVILSPHVAGWTIESHERLSQVLYDKIKRLADANP